MKVLTIAITDVRRLLRWRANIFFLFVLPMMIILLLGAAFGGSDQARIGVVGGNHGALAQRFVGSLAAQPSVTIVRYTSRPALEHAVARGDVDAGLLVPARYDAAISAGTSVSLGYIGRPDSVAQQLRMTVQSVAEGQSRAFAAAGALQHALRLGFAAALVRARAAAARTPAVRTQLVRPDGSAYSSTLGRFDTGASTQLLLFIFLNSLQGAAWLIETRRLGIARRMLSTPTAPRTIVAGQLFGRFAIALLQALIIVLGSMLFFGVNWGNPLGAALVIVAFCLVGTGAAVLLGSLFSNEQQAGPIALLLGLGLAALGGSMAPLDVFPNTARAIAHAAPHAWANDAFSKLLAHGGTAATVLPQVAVLLAFAGVTTVLAVWLFRRALTVTS
ncbi:MAG TPA: ABC transporter permease [Solirubrobacteraceae bacterium]|nr:ABC transporter permease [Solirubrobacteraceae bacterium]